MWVTISMWEIVGGVVRHHDLVVKMKFFPTVFVRDSRKFMLAKFLTIRYISSLQYLLPSQKF